MSGPNRQPEAKSKDLEQKGRGSSQRQHGETEASGPSPAVAAGRIMAGTGRLTPREIFALQRTVGNKAVCRLLDVRRAPLGPRDSNGVAAGAEEAVDRAATSTGHSLPENLRRSFESSLGADLSSVRVHTGSESSAAAAAVGAQAYTVGQDIHFGAGYFAPADPAGARLLAHEVAHTQQRHGSAPGRGNKLDVSTPADAAEIEADHASDAMMAGHAFDLGGQAAGVHRQETPPGQQTGTPPQQPGTPPPPPPAPTSPGAPSPQATPGTATPTGDNVNSQWQVDWVGKETGSVISNQSNARTGKDAAYGTLKVNPETGQMQSFQWMNAASAGAVDVGSMPHPKDKAGTVASSVAYGKPPSASAAITVTASEDADKKDKPKQATINAKQKAASAAVANRLQQDLENMGDITAIEADLRSAATTAVGNAPDGYTYDVAVKLTPQLDADQGHPKSAPAVPYERFAADGKRVVTITVPTEIQKLKGTASAESQNVNQSSSAQQTFDQNKTDQSHTDTTTTDLQTKITTVSKTAFHQAWQDLKSHKKANATELSGSADVNIDGATSADLAGKDFKIDIGKLLALVTIEDPPLALALKTAVGSVTLDGKLHAALTAGFDGSVSGKTSWSESDEDTTFKLYDSKMESAITTEVSSRVTRTVTDTTNTLTDAQKSAQQSQGKLAQNRVASTTETVGVKFIEGDPAITVKSM